MKSNFIKMETELIRAILKMQLAYKFYLEDKMYFQAKRIYKSNTVIYDLLLKYLVVCDEDIFEDISNYIFHLDDWMLQFDDLEKTVTNLEQSFVFNRLEKSIPFPKEIIAKLNNKL